MRVRISLAPNGTWRRGEEVDLEEAMMAAALAARRAGGLPQGSVLVVSLGESLVPEAGLDLMWSRRRSSRNSPSGDG